MRIHLTALAALILLATAGCSEPPTSATPTPTPIPTINPALLEFQARVQAALTQQGAFVRQFAEASAGLPGELTAPAAAVGVWVDQEREWADEHRPDPCFTDAHAAYVEGLERLSNAAALFGAIASGASTDAVAAQEATKALSDGRDLMEDALALADLARADCR